MSPARPGAQRTLSDKFYLQVSTTNIHAAGISCCLSWTWVCPGLQSGPGSHRQCSVSPARPGAQRTLSDKFYLQVSTTNIHAAGISCCLSWTWVCPGLQSGPGSHRQCSVSPARPGAQRKPHPPTSSCYQDLFMGIHSLGGLPCTLPWPAVQPHLE